MNSLTNKLYAPPNKYIYLSLFRLFICLHLLKKIFFLWPSLDTIYGAGSFVAHYQNLFDLSFFQANYKAFLFIYIGAIILYAFGIGKHFTALVVYLSLELFQRMNLFILNGGDNLLKFAMLYMVFCDSYQYFCLQKLRFKHELSQKISHLFTNLGTFSICLHLCLVYFTTAMHKINSKVWFSGVALYYTLSLERFMGTSYNLDLAKNGLFVTVGSYFTLLWEAYFPVLIWVKKLRPYLIVGGFALHLGIYWFMMIHDFQIFFLACYGFFFTDQEWRSGWQRLQRWLGKS